MLAVELVKHGNPRAERLLPLSTHVAAKIAPNPLVGFVRKPFDREPGTDAIAAFVRVPAQGKCRYMTFDLSVATRSDPKWKQIIVFRSTCGAGGGKHSGPMSASPFKTGCP